jgi:hypothetical protein
MSTSVKILIGIATVALLVLAAVSLGLIGRVVPDESTEPVELRTYSVPAQQQEEIRRMLRSALESEGNRVGRVSAGPSGTVLVVAPPRIQRGVEAILGDLKKLESPPPQPAPVKIVYWILVGRPLASASAPFTFTGGRPPGAIEPVLREIATAQGPTEFAMLEQLEVTSMERAEIGGHAFRVHQRTTRAGDRVVADVSIAFLRGGNKFDSRVVLDPKRVVVLAQSGYDGKAGRIFDAESDANVTLYYVMAADLDS